MNIWVINVKDNINIYLIIKIVLGILIMLAPVIITGRFYNETSIIGPLLISEYLMRTSSFIIGLLVIYDSIKSNSK